MSHELRTPLNAILGFGQLLEVNPAEPLGPAQKKYVKQILNAGRHLLTLINEVLDLTKIKSGKNNLDIQEFDPGVISEECVELARTLGMELNIQVVHASGQALGIMIVADPRRFRQVLLNLLANAVKYNKQGGQVTLAYATTNKGMLQVRVSDPGPGIPNEQIDTLFQPFNRLQREDTAIEGTGVGLAISKKLVELMGGRIYVESEVSKGTTFFVDLPLGGG